MIIKNNVYNKIKKSGKLPTLPEVLLQLLKAFDNEATPLTEIASIMNNDPALSARVLQLVNSAYYSLNSTFSNVEQAVVYLGANSIKNIAVTTAVHQIFARKQFTIRGFNLNTFWWRSLMCATLAKRIAKKTRYDCPDEAYLSGLLHDIGRLILLTSFPKEYETIYCGGEDISAQLLSETQLIGISHCEAGAWLINTWKLNSMMADAVLWHHGSIEQIKEAFPLVKIVFFSNMLSGQLHEQDCETGELLLGLSSGDLREIVDGATEEVLQIAKDLNIKIRPPEKDERKSAAEELPACGQSAEPDADTEVQNHLAERVQSISLLAGILENLVLADGSEGVIAVFEQAMRIVFNISKVIFFLPDEELLLLKGRTSSSNTLQHLSQGLILSVQRSTSLIVTAYRQSSMMYLTAENSRGVLADEQLFTAIRCATVVLVPLAADKHPAGVILLGLPETASSLSESDSRLLRMIAQQVGLCLFLERMKLQKAKEIEAERMAAISVTARKFAHEINNPMGIITNCIAVMGLKLSSQNEIQEELRILGEEINRISSMVRHMDLFSQDAVTPLNPTDVNMLIRDILHIVKEPLFTALGKEITFRPETGLPRITTSSDALKQIMLNLLKNASEGMGSGGSVEVRTAVVSKNPYENSTRQEDEIEIAVEDTGPGLPEHVMKNLYKPLVTTKGNGHSGLGLSIVYKLVKDLGGSIICSSIPAEGTKFSIRLPAGKKVREKKKLSGTPNMYPVDSAIKDVY